MTPRINPDCPHERRAGTTYCLYCRREARIAARERLKRVGLRVGAIVIAGGVLAVVGVAVASVIPGRRAPARPLPARAVSVFTSESTPAAPAAAVARPTDNTSRPAAGPIIGEGNASLAPDVMAVRHGDTVRVLFDAATRRTRRADKFEHVLRETLPAVFGSRADAALARVVSGALIRPGELIGVLPTRGLQLVVGDGSTLVVWPETRPGQDGPLVVSYRAVLTR